MIKSRLYAKAKVGRMPKIMSLSDAEISNLLQEASLEAEDIKELLNGRDVGLLDFEDLEDIPAEVIIQGLKIHYDEIRERGKQEGEILAWQYNGGFDPDANEAARLVSGQKIDFRKVKGMEESDLREWFIKYLTMLQ
jgi:hypothetical protein